MKDKETIEEAAEHYAHNWFNMHETNNYKALRDGFIAGAKYQAQQNKKMYSLEDLRNCFYDAKTPSYQDFGEWFEQYFKETFDN